MGFLGGLLKKVGGALPGIGTAISIGSGLVSAISGAKKGAKADKLQEQRVAQAQQRFNAGAPFRARLAELAKRPTAQRQDLSGMIADPGNPYSRAQAPRPPLASMAAPAPQPMARPPMPPVVGGGGPMGGSPRPSLARLAQLQMQQRGLFR